MSDVSTDQAAVLERWESVALRRDASYVVIPFGVFGHLDEQGRRSMIATLVQWALGADASAMERHGTSEDAARGAEPWQEPILVTDLAANALFGLATEREESRPLLQDHLGALREGASTQVSLARVLASLGESTPRPLLDLLRQDASATSRILTAAAIAWECNNPYVSTRLVGLLAVIASVRVAAVVETCQNLGADDCWEPFYGPLRTWSTEASLPLPSIQRAGASEFAAAVVARLAEGVSNRDTFTIEAIPNHSAIVAFSEALRDPTQAVIDVGQWATFGAFGKRWATGQLFRRLLHFVPDARALDAVLELEPPGYQQALRELQAHLGWLDQYAAEPSTVFNRLGDLVRGFSPSEDKRAKNSLSARRS